MLVYQRVLFAIAVGVYTHAKGIGSIVTCIEVDLNKSNSRPRNFENTYHVLESGYL